MVVGTHFPLDIPPSKRADARQNFMQERMRTILGWGMMGERE